MLTFSWLSLRTSGCLATAKGMKCVTESSTCKCASKHPQKRGYERCVCLVCSGKFCGIAMYCIHVSLQVDIIYALFPRQLSVLSFSAILVSDVWTAYVRIHHVLDSRVLLSCQCWHHLCPLCWQILWTARIDVHVAVGNPSRPAWPTWLDSWSPLSLDSPEG